MQSVSFSLTNKRAPLDILVDNVSIFDERSAPDRVTLQREIKNKGYWYMVSSDYLEWLEYARKDIIAYELLNTSKNMVGWQ